MIVFNMAFRQELCLNNFFPNALNGVNTTPTTSAEGVYYHVKIHYYYL